MKYLKVVLLCVSFSSVSFSQETPGSEPLQSSKILLNTEKTKLLEECDGLTKKCEAIELACSANFSKNRILVSKEIRSLINRIEEQYGKISNIPTLSKKIQDENANSEDDVLKTEIDLYLKSVNQNDETLKFYKELKRRLTIDQENDGKINELNQKLNRIKNLLKEHNDDLSLYLKEKSKLEAKVSKKGTFGKISNFIHFGSKKEIKELIAKVNQLQKAITEYQNDEILSSKMLKEFEKKLASAMKLQNSLNEDIKLTESEKAKSILEAANRQLVITVRKLTNYTQNHAEIQYNLKNILSDITQEKLMIEFLQLKCDTEEEAAQSQKIVDDTKKRLQKIDETIEETKKANQLKE